MSESSKKMASMNEAKSDDYLLTESVSDPIDDAKPVSLFDDEGNGVMSFKKVNGDKFLITPFGVDFLPSGISADKTVKVCAPIEVIARYRDKDGDGWGRVIRWLDDDKTPHYLRASEGDLATNYQEVFNALNNGGLTVYQFVSRGAPSRVIDFIKSYPAEALPLQRSTQSFGWFKDGEVFVLPNAIIGDHRGEQVIFDGESTHAPKYSTKGTLKEWQENVASVARYSARISFFICMAFAAPLLRLVNEQSGGFHLVGGSSLGKSSALRAMCSVFGSASSSGDAGEMATWRTTDNALEAVCQAHSDLPLICDELKQAEERKLANIIYMIGNEMGKRRMSGKTLTCKPTASWKLLLASSGEATIEELAKRVGLTVDNGVNVRLANITVDKESGYGIFDVWPNGDPKEVTEKLRADTESRYYGTAGIEFLERLLASIRENGLEAFKENLTQGLSIIQAELMPKTETDEMVGRVCRRFALVALAGEVAIAYGVLPWEIGAAKASAKRCFDIWRKDFKTIADQEAEMLEHVKTYHEPNRERFDVAKQATPLEETRLPNRLGVLALNDDDEVIAVYYIVRAFHDEVLKKYGYAVKSGMEVLAKSGVLDINEKSRHTKKLPKHSLNGVPAGRYVVVKMPNED